jgi:hypothetical protein
MSLITSGLAIASLVWLAVGIITGIGQLRLGLVLLIVAVFAIAVITGYELVLNYRARQASPERLRAAVSSS